jgi:hypothetical protein
MQRKYNSIIENKIYIFVNLSKGRKTLKSKWIFDVKVIKSNELDDPEFKFFPITGHTRFMDGIGLTNGLPVMEDPDVSIWEGVLD